MNMALTLKTWNKKRVLTSLPDFWFLALLLAGWIDLGRSVFSGEWHMMIILVVLFLSVLTAIFVKQILNRKAALSIIIGVILLLVSFYLLLALFAEFAEFQSAGEPRAVELMLGGVTVVGGSSSLSGEVGVTVATIKSWLSVLQASYIAYSLPPYFENIGKRLVKSPKLYFYDTGLICYLLGIENEQQLALHPLRGAIFENMVVNEAIKNRLNKAKDPNLYFYRDKSQKEVDLLHLMGNQIQAYEIKSGKSYLREYYKGIDYIKEIFKQRLVKSALIYDGMDEIQSEENGAYNFRHFYLGD